MPPVTLPTLVAMLIVYTILAVTVALWRYCVIHPDSAQAKASQALRTLRTVTRRSYRIARWLVTLVASLVAVTVCIPVWWLMSIAYILLMKVAGEPASVRLKLA